MVLLKHERFGLLYNKIAFTILNLLLQSVKAGYWTNGYYIHVWPLSPNTDSLNMYSVGSTVNNWRVS